MPTALFGLTALEHPELELPGDVPARIASGIVYAQIRSSDRAANGGVRGLPLDGALGEYAYCWDTAFSALFLGRMLKGAEVPEALSGATATVFAFFAATRRSGASELELIAAQDEIVAPSRTFPVERLA